MDDAKFGRNYGGGQITRQISSSHVVPRSMSGYQEFFRMSSSREEGWLETKIGRAEHWERMWFVFDDGVLFYSSYRDADRDDSEAVTRVPMDRVISLRTDDQYGDSTIQIVTTEHKLYIRAPSKDEMFRWLFCFQKSVALVLSKLLANSSKTGGGMSAGPSNFGSSSDRQIGIGAEIGRNRRNCSSDFVDKDHRIGRTSGAADCMDNEIADDYNETDGIEEDSQIWLAELGHGHGKHSSLASRRITYSEGLSQSLNPSRSTSMFLCDQGEDDGDKVSNLVGGCRNTSPGSTSAQEKEKEAARRSVWDRSYAERSVVDLTRISQLDSTFETLNGSKSVASGKGKFMSSAASVSKSPMIPIVELMTSRSLFDPKLASSYNDNGNRDRSIIGLSLSPPETERGRSASEGSHCSDQSNGRQLEFGDDAQSSESDGDMMFDFDDLDIQPSPVTKKSARKTKSSRSRGNSDLSNGSSTVGAACKPLRRHNSHTSNVQQQSDSPRLRWSCGSCTRLGPRTSNEDRLVAMPNLTDVAASKRAAGIVGLSVLIDASASPCQSSSSSGQSGAFKNISATGIGVGQRDNEKHGYFAVYDGHCGAQAATHLQETLHLSIFNHPLYHTDLHTAIVESCVNTDKAFLAESREKKQYSGTTALGTILRGNELVVFNIGDCHAVLCCNGVALDVSDAHKPNRPDESARILAAKGWITEEKELYMARLHRMDLSDPVVRDKAQQVSWVTIHRVCGEISVSRSIGDPDYKSFIPGEKVDAFFIWPDGHDQVFMADLLIPVPECRTYALHAGHEFLVIASDGLWDVVSGTEAVTRARSAFSLGKSASEAAEELCDLALKLGSSDNVTVVIVQFIHC